MSLESAIKVLSQPQAISQNEVAAATVESETKTNNDAKIADTAADKSGVVDAKSAEATDTKPTETKEPLSAKFSALAKKEKAIVKRDQEIKAKEATFAEREATIAAREAKIKESESLWETDVFKALELRGYDYTKLTQLMLDGKTAAPVETDPVKLAKKTIDEFKKEQAELKAREEEAAKKAKEEAERKQKEELEAAWSAFRDEVNEFVTSNEADYELINLYGQQQLVVDTVNEYFEKTRAEGKAKVLSVKEASDLVENYLLEEAKKAMQSKKLAAQKTEPAKKTEEPRIQNTKTLNNSMQPTAASVLPAQSEADRMRRALSALEGKR